MKTLLENIDKLKKILLQENINSLDKALAQKLLLEIYEEITFSPTSDNKQKKEFEESKMEDKGEKSLQAKQTNDNNLPIAENGEENISIEKQSEQEEQQIYSEKVQKQEIQEERIVEQVQQQYKSSVSDAEEVKEQEHEEQKDKDIFDKKQSQSTLSEVLGEHKAPTVYDLLKDLRNNTDLVTKLANQPISNIAKAITLNDKLMFIRELFGGNADAYNEAISRINNASGLEEALNILSGYNIDTTKDSAGLLIRVLYRRFEN